MEYNIINKQDKGQNMDITDYMNNSQHNKRNMEYNIINNYKTKVDYQLINNYKTKVDYQLEGRGT